MRLALCAYDCYDVFKYTKDWMAATFVLYLNSLSRQGLWIWNVFTGIIIASLLPVINYPKWHLKPLWTSDEWPFTACRFQMPSGSDTLSSHNANSKKYVSGRFPCREKKKKVGEWGEVIVTVTSSSTSEVCWKWGWWGDLFWKGTSDLDSNAKTCIKTSSTIKRLC